LCLWFVEISLFECAVEKECPVINQDDAITKPWFLIDANNIVVEVGQQAMFEAQATGQPMPSVKWSDIV